MTTNEMNAVLEIKNGLKSIAHAITPPLAGSTDASGGHVESLTEAVMGLTQSMCHIADALNNIAESIRDNAAN